MRGCWILCSRGARGVGGTGGECEGGAGDGGVCVCPVIWMLEFWSTTEIRCKRDILDASGRKETQGSYLAEKRSTSKNSSVHFD